MAKSLLVGRDGERGRLKYFLFQILDPVPGFCIPAPYTLVEEVSHSPFFLTSNVLPFCHPFNPRPITLSTMNASTKALCVFADNCLLRDYHSAWHIVGAHKKTIT